MERPFTEFVVVTEGRYSYLRPVWYCYERTDGRRAVTLDEVRDLDVLYPLTRKADEPLF